MAEPTLAQIFGSNAAQDAATLTISKADLATVGLSASATNKAESLLVAIILFAKSYLTDANLQANADQSISIEDSFPAIVTRGTVNYRQNTLSINLLKPDTAATIDPDDY